MHGRMSAESLVSTYWVPVAPFHKQKCLLMLQTAPRRQEIALPPLRAAGLEGRLIVLHWVLGQNRDGAILTGKAQPQLVSASSPRPLFTPSNGLVPTASCLLNMLLIIPAWR